MSGREVGEKPLPVPRVFCGRLRRKLRVSFALVMHTPPYVTVPRREKRALAGQQGWHGRKEGQATLGGV